MSDLDPKFAKVLDFFKLANESLTRDDFIRAFKAVISTITTLEFNLTNRIDARLARIRDGKDGKDGRTPRKGIDYFDGRDGVGVKGDKGEKGDSIEGKPGRDGSPDTADDIRNKLELLPDGEKLAIDAIQDLREELDELKRARANSTSTTTFAISRGQIKLYDLSTQLDGVTKTFALPAFWRVITVESTSAPAAFRPNIDYNTDGNAMTITFTSEIDAGSTLAAGQSLNIIYAEP